MVYTADNAMSPYTYCCTNKMLDQIIQMAIYLMLNRHLIMLREHKEAKLLRYLERMVINFCGLEINGSHPQKKESHATKIYYIGQYCNLKMIQFNKLFAKMLHNYPFKNYKNNRICHLNDQCQKKFKYWLQKINNMADFIYTGIFLSAAPRYTVFN